MIEEWPGNSIPCLQFIPRNDICIQPPEEYFMWVTDKIVPNVKPYYMISNYGRLWSTYRGKLLACNVDSKGYLYKPLARFDDCMINCRIHRLVMMTFNYFPGCENAMINHIDGNKCNPAIWNLEWTDLSQNGKHAWENDMRLPGKSKVSDDVAKIVCRLIVENRLTNRQIAEICGLTVDDVNSISAGVTHKNISAEFHFPERKLVISREKVRVICAYFASHPRNKKLKTEYCSEALMAAGIEINTSTLSVAERILYHQNFKDISKDYNF